MSLSNNPASGIALSVNVNRETTLAVLGCSVLDVVLPGITANPAGAACGEFHSSNVTLLKSPPVVSVGGNGANAALAASALGAKVHLFTSLSEDAAGKLLRHYLNEAGCIIHAEAVHATPVNVSLLDPDQHRTTYFYPPAPCRLAHVKDVLPAPDHVLFCGWPHHPLPEAVAVMSDWCACGSRIHWDIGPLIDFQWSLGDLNLLRGCLHTLIANEAEILALASETEVGSAVAAIRRVFDGDILVKRGPRGACWYPGDPSASLVDVEAPPVKVYSTIGAGDVFNGVWLAQLIQGTAMPEALTAAVQAASAVVASPLGLLALLPLKPSTAQADLFAETKP